MVAVGIAKLFQLIQYVVEHCLFSKRRIQLLFQGSGGSGEEEEGGNYGFTNAEWQEMERQMKEDEEKEEAENMKDVD